MKHICTEVCDLQNGHYSVAAEEREPASAGRFFNQSSRRLQLTSVEIAPNAKKRPEDNVTVKPQHSEM